MKKLLSIILTLALVLSMATFVGAEDTGLVDVALNMTAFSNTYYHAANANNAIDGDPETFFFGKVNTVGGTATQVYWYVDLGAEYPIEKISFLPGVADNADVSTNIGRLLDIYLTNTRPTACTVDGAVQVYDGSSTPLSIEEYTDVTVTAEGTYRYVLFSKDATLDNLGIALRDVNVYTDVDSYNATTRGEGYVNIAAQKPVYTTMQTNETGHSLTRANDGLMGSTSNAFYILGRNVTYAGLWFVPDVVVDLNDAYSIKYLNFGFGSGTPAKISVYVTNDPTLKEMTTVVEGYTPKGEFQFDLLDITDATPYRYIVLRGDPSGCWINVGEIEAYVARSDAKNTDFENQSIVEISRNMKSYLSPEGVDVTASKFPNTSQDPALSNDGNSSTAVLYSQDNLSTPSYYYIDLGTSQNIHSASFLTTWGSAWTGSSTAYQAAGFNRDMYLIGTNDNTLSVTEWDVLATIPSTIKLNDGKLKIMPVAADKLNNKYRYVGVYYNQMYQIMTFDEFRVHASVSKLNDAVSPVTATLSGTTLTVAADTVVPTASTNYTIIAAAYTGTDAKRLAGIKIGTTPSFTANTINGNLLYYSGGAVMTGDAFSTAIDVTDLDLANADSLKVMIVDNMSCMKPIVAMVDVPLQ